MKLNELTYTSGARNTSKRLGRGIGSGKGKNGGSGHKGQKSRSGGGVRLGFEGGQNPIYRRLPKRGFTNYTTVEYAIVNVGDLNRFEDGTHVTPTLLVEARLVTKEFNGGIKIVGNGKLERKLTVSAHKFSKGAEQAITAVGGSVEVL